MNAQGQSAGCAINCYEQDGTMVISLKGELDLAGAPALALAIIDALELGGPRVLIDLDRVTFLDSAGLRTLRAAQKLCEERGCDFAIATPPAPVVRVLELAGVDGYIPCRDSFKRRSDARAVPLAPCADGDAHPIFPSFGDEIRESS
jgi:anti-anti-sigma factor